MTEQSLRLFLESTGAGTRETWQPDEDDPEDVAAMAELGWVRASGSAHYEPTSEELKRAADARTDTEPPDADHAAVVKPCPVHGTAGYSVCSACRAWNDRDRGMPQLPSERIANLLVANIESPEFAKLPAVSAHIAAIVTLLDERLGRASGTHDIRR